MPVCISNKDLERLIKEDDNILRKAALKELVRVRAKFAESKRILRKINKD